MKADTELKVKWGGWGLVGGAAAAMIIGFNWGGWTTQGTTQLIPDAAVPARSGYSDKQATWRR